MILLDEPLTPPWSQDAEQSTLGGMMILQSNDDRFQWCAKNLIPDDFYRPDHRAIFKAILALVEKNSPHDLVMMGSELLQKQYAMGSNAGSIASYVGTLVKDTPSAANLKGYGKLVKNSSVRRKVLSVTQEIAAKAYEPDFSDESVNALMSYSTKEIFELDQNRTSSDKIMKKLQPALKEMLTDIQNDIAAGVDGVTLRGVAGGYPSVDNRLRGYEPGKLYYEAGRPAMGKTTFAINQAEYMAVNNPDMLVAFFSIEMTIKELAEKITSSSGRVDYGVLRNPIKIQEDHWAKIAQGISRLSKTNLYIEDDSRMTPNKLRERLRATLQSTGMKPLAVFVDHFHIMKGDALRYDNENAELTDISGNLREIAKEFNVPVIALAQCNRSCDGRTNRRPIMSDLRGAGAMEQDAHAIGFVYRDAYYADIDGRLDEMSEDEKRRSEIIWRKIRAGQTGTDFLSFFGEFQRFDEYSPEVEQPGGWK